MQILKGTTETAADKVMSYYLKERNVRRYALNQSTILKNIVEGYYGAKLVLRLTK